VAYLSSRAIVLRSDVLNNCMTQNGIVCVLGQVLRAKGRVGLELNTSRSAEALDACVLLEYVAVCLNDCRGDDCPLQ
jgi:hypothetical protein